MLAMALQLLSQEVTEGLLELAELLLVWEQQQEESMAQPWAVPATLVLEAMLGARLNMSSLRASCS